MENQPDRVSLKPILWICGTLLLAHIAVDGLLTSQRALLPSGILLLLENALAAAMCFWRARRSRGSGKLLWTLAGAAETLHFLSGFEVGLEMVFFHVPHNVTSPSDFIIFLWGVPLLLALGGPTESRSTRIFYWLDGAQITLIMVISFVVVFGALPFQHTTAPFLSGIGAVWAYVIENFCIAVVALLRLQTRAPIREQRAFFTSIAISISIYAVFGPIYNFLNVLSSAPWIRLQFLLSFHQLAIAILAVSPVTWPSTPGRASRHKTLARVLDNATPIVYPLCVLIGAIAILPHHLHLGIGIILVSLICYGSRSTVLQLRFQSIQTQMADAQRRLEQMTLTDPLTGIANRRAFNNRLSAAWDHYQNTHQSFCVFLIDVDHFKMLNDTLGHTEGDRCLCAIAKALPAQLKQTNDLIARVGGEEFAAILMNTTAEQSIPVAHAMMNAVALLELPNATPIGKFVTISVGVTESSHAQSEEEMIRTADDALYRAKRTGRNRTIIG